MTRIYWRTGNDSDGESMMSDHPNYAGEKMPPGVANPAAVNPGPGPYRLAEWGSRVAASLINGVIICLIAAVIFVPLAGAFPFLTDSTGAIIGLVLAWLGGIFIFCIALALYAPILLVKWNGQTVGKRMLSIRVIQTSGEKFDFFQAF